MAFYKIHHVCKAKTCVEDGDILESTKGKAEEQSNYKIRTSQNQGR
jgi:hypothetical protein